MKILILVVLSLSLLCTDLSAQEVSSLVINTKGAQPSVNGSTDHFTGVVRVEAPFKGAEGARVSGATVTFKPSARTAWHSHPLGQTLVITSGAGFVQESGHAARSINPGDTVWIPPNVKHWHGANATTHMTHIAISEVLDGNVVNWMEKVSEAQYAEAYSGI